MVQVARRQYEWLIVQRPRDVGVPARGGNRLLRRLLAVRDRTTELPLAVLAIGLWDSHDLLQQRKQGLLRRRDDGVGNLRLLPENLPVGLLGGLHAVQLGLPCPALPMREELPERD